MSPIVVAVGVVDVRGIRGTGIAPTPWSEPGERAPGGPRTLRRVFGRVDDTFRRLDATSRALVLAAEAAGLDRALPAAEREATALVVETCLGSLDSDLRFARSMVAGMCDGPTFAYTLPSTSLGEVALRLGARGASICLSVPDGRRGAALHEATQLIATGEARFAIAGTVDVLREADAPAAERCLAIVALIADAATGVRPAIPWPGSEGDGLAGLGGRSGPFDAMAEAIARAHGGRA